jgi:hypothetical protein
MRKHFLFFLILLIFIPVFAQESPTFQQPVVITSAGQSAGATMMKVLATRANLQFTFEPLIKADNLTNDVKTIIIVVGASSKGLGAAGLDVNQEKERITGLLNKAKEIGIKIIVAHIEGQSRRGKTSDELSKLVVPLADLVIVTKSGNEDNFFTDLCEKQEKHIVIVDTTSAVQDILKQYFKAGE